MCPPSVRNHTRSSAIPPHFSCTKCFLQNQRQGKKWCPRRTSGFSSKFGLFLLVLSSTRSHTSSVLHKLAISWLVAQPIPWFWVVQSVEEHHWALGGINIVQFQVFIEMPIGPNNPYLTHTWDPVVHGPSLMAKPCRSLWVSATFASA